MQPQVLPPSRHSSGVVVLVGLLLTGAVWAAFALVSSCPPSVVGELSPERLRAHMAILADDRLEGRETGTRGFDAAARYVAAEFRKMGLAAIDGRYLQPFALRRARVIEGGTSLVFVREGRREVLEYGRDFVTYGDTFHDVIDVTGPLVSVGDGVTVPGRGVDAYAGRETVGRVVVALPGAPESLTPGERAYFESATVKAATAAQHGASALLLVAEAHIPWDLRVRAARQLGSSRSWLGGPERERVPPAIPVVYLSRTVAATLLGPEFGQAGESAASLGSASLQIQSDAREVRSANVWAVLNGSDPRLASEYVVITAHLDHVGIGSPVDGDAIYNGAVDNASGVAGLLVVARALAASPTPPARSILFVATTGEEQGEIGAEYLVRHPPVPRDRLVAAINIDGLSFMPFTAADAMGGAQSSLGPLAQQAADPQGIRLRLQPAGVSGSDHAPFLRAGIPVLWIGSALSDEWMRTRYHAVSDDMRQPLDFEAAATHARLVLAVADRAARVAERPTWHPGEFFQTLRE